MIIHSKEEFLGLVHELQRTGKKIISTNGCFDILHPGHIETFARARELGDILIVLVNSDTNPYFGTKPGRPINQEDSRMIMLDAIKYIDIVYPFSEETPVWLLEEIRPDIHVKGGDYIKENLPEYTAVRKYWGDVMIISTVDGYSTTKIIGRILEVYGK
jgi:D-glycero-beta-D-manno-heptose 1-phosphate adenylyltransferase